MKGGLEPVESQTSSESGATVVPALQGAEHTVVSTPNAPINDWRRPGGRLSAEQAVWLLDEIGEPQWSSEEEARGQVADAIDALPSAEAQRLLQAFSPRDARSSEVDLFEGLERLTNEIYEGYKTGKEEVLRRLVNQGGKAGKEAEHAPAGEVPPADEGAGAGGTRSEPTAEAYDESGATEDTRFSQPRGASVSEYLAPEAYVRAAWRDALDTASANGLLIRPAETRP